MDTEGQINLLADFISDHKKSKIEAVLAQRTRKVTLIIEDLYHAQNTSALIRTCECMGVQDLNVIEDKNNMETSARVVQGSSKWVTSKIFSRSQVPNPAEKCISNLKEEGYSIVATDLSDKSIPISELPISEKMAFVFGTEISGVSETILNQSDYRIHLPMEGFTDSYNVSVSAALCLQQILPQYKTLFPSWQLSEPEMNELRLDWYKSVVRRSDLILERGMS